jgi:hypothetical protein
MAEDGLSSDVLAALQAEGLDAAPAEWLDHQRCRARSEGEVDALDDPVKAARRYQRAKEQEAERQRKFRYVRGLPPLEEPAALADAAGSAPRSSWPDRQAASARPTSATSMDRPPAPRTDNIRVRHRTRPPVPSPDAATCRPDLKIVRTPLATKTHETGLGSGSPALPAADAAVLEHDPRSEKTRNIRVRHRMRPPSLISSTDPSIRPPEVEAINSPKTETTSNDIGVPPVAPATSSENDAVPAADRGAANDGRPQRRPGEYSVGKGKPPLHTRFKPGQCGNPKGRPKGAKNVKTVALEILMRKMPATINGKKSNIIGFGGLLEKQFAVGLGGSLKSAVFMLEKAGLLAPAQGQGEGADPSAAPPDPLLEPQQDILTFYKRDLLEAAGVDPATIEAILKGVTEEPDPPSNQADTPKAAGGSR